MINIIVSTLSTVLILMLLMFIVNAVTVDEFNPLYWFVRHADHDKIFMDFDVFMRFKQINPEKWDWGHYDFVYYCCERIYMNSFIDYIKLGYARANKNELEAIEKQKERTRDLAKMWMEDIENFKRNGGSDI